MNAPRKSGRAPRVSSGLLSCVFAVGSPLLPALCAQAQQVDANPAKAAFLYHFAQMVYWPLAVRDSSQALTLCVFGNDSLGGSIDSVIDGKSVGAQTIHVRHLGPEDHVQDCQMLYIGHDGPVHIAAILAEARQHSVLTIGEDDDFLAQGGVIAFVLEGGRLRFEINLESAESSHILISSRLLQLSRRVVGGRDDRQ